MHIQSRTTTAMNAWRQLPKLHKLLAISLLVSTLLLALWQTGTVDVSQLSPQHGAAIPATNGAPAAPRAIGGGIPLRIMFMGASMTLGEHSTGHRGFRKQVRDWLVGLGNPVNCVGANRYGDFADNDVQAFGAQPIKPTLDRARKIVQDTQPNLIIINSGSSDCFQENWGPAHSLQYMRELVEFLLEASPRAAIIMSTVITCPWADECVKGLNAQVRQVAIDLSRRGKHVVMAEMHFDQDQPGAPQPSDIGPDNMHPTDEGYFMMGRLFMDKIREVDKKGWLQPPVDNGILLDGDDEDREIEEYQTNGERVPEESRDAGHR